MNLQEAKARKSTKPCKQKKERGTSRVLKWCLLAGMSLGLSQSALAQSTVQWVAIMRGFADQEHSPDSLGYFYIPTPNTYWSEQLFEAYRELSGDTLSRFVRLRQWTDSFVHHHHYEYQHYFMDIPVVGGIIREHFSERGLYLIHGKVGLFDGVDTINLKRIKPPDVAVMEFLTSHFKYPGDTTLRFAWKDSFWEQQIKCEYGNKQCTASAHAMPGLYFLRSIYPQDSNFSPQTLKLIVVK